MALKTQSLSNISELQRKHKNWGEKSLGKLKKLRVSYSGNDFIYMLTHKTH